MQETGENSVSPKKEPRGRMYFDEGQRHRDEDAGKERERIDCICT